MRVGIVGLPLVGKTTIFNLLTHGHVETSAWGARAEAHIGAAHVPDTKLDRLAEVFKPERKTHATVEYVDLPGLARGEGKAALEGQPKEMGAYLTNLKNVETLLHIVRAFEDPAVPHSEGSVDPARDMALFELEMMFSDLAIVEKRLERLSKDLKKVRSAELETENSVLERFKTSLESEKPLRELTLTPEEEKRIRGFTFLSAKPILHVINLGDADAAQIPHVVQRYGLTRFVSEHRSAVTAVCGKIEAEIESLPDDDAAGFMADLGLSESGLTRIIHESYALLGLISFYTVGEPEARAWSIPRDSTALQAAGAIHTDFERGFIKAEVVAYDPMIEAGSYAAARSRGVLRLEGKDYVVQEGDVILFRFNV
jgi:GTP-binding protein YchF